RARTPRMRARLERAVQRAAGRAGPCGVERDNLGMWPSGRRGRTLADDDTVAVNDNGADRWIGTRAAPSPLRPEQRALHERAIDVGSRGYHFSVKSASTYAPASNGRRSFKPSPMPIYRIGSLRSCAMA